MTTNILLALKNILDNSNNELLKVYESKVHNRANNMGEALEYYIKDIFCNTIEVDDFNEKDRRYSDYLSYIGNNNNPPDFIIKGDAAVEVKKLEKAKFGYIALNSSHPKDKLHSNSTLINKACRKCEDDLGGWNEKDMIYAVGNMTDNKLRVLWLLYGDCYCASEDIYLKIKSTIATGIQTISGVEFAESKELGRVNKIDPLGVTYLRIRGMWGIDHPMNVFSYLVEDYNELNNYQVYVLVTKEKYDLLPKEDKEKLLEYILAGRLQKYEVEIKNPNNPAKYIKAVFFKATL